MGLDVATFSLILSAGFEDHWDTLSITREDVAETGFSRPRCRSLDAAGGLGLMLHYLSSTMRETTLQQIFALTPTVVSRYLNFAKRILLLTLKRLPEARIQWPKGDEFEDLTEMIAARHPLLRGAFGVIDGLNLPVEVSNNMEIENSCYNSWLHGHFISSVFAFSPEGKL